MDNLELYTCDQMAQTIRDGETGLIYNPKYREFGIRVMDGGTSVILIRYCPFCGKSLPTSLRYIWIERLDSLGLESIDPAVPEVMRSDAWWKNEGL
jgi:hypothetical protein